jgi:hypothetical protein
MSPNAPSQRCLIAAIFIGDAYVGTAPCRLTCAQLKHLVPAGSLLVDDQGCGFDAAGLEHSDDGCITIVRAGRYAVHSCLSTPPQYARDGGDDHHGDRPNQSLRDAQFMCGVFGLLVINCIIFFDAENRLANVKDFAINYASDMLAVGSILVLAEYYHKGKRRADRRGS